MPCDPATLKVGQSCYRATVFQPGANPAAPSQRVGPLQPFAGDAVRDGERMSKPGDVWYADELVKQPDGKLDVKTPEFASGEA